MFTRSIRWRLILWLAFLLTCILSGFGVTAYQLHRLNLLSQIDDELERRVAALRSELRPRTPGRVPGFEPGPGGPPPRRPPPSPDDRLDPRDFREFHEFRELHEPREFREFHELHELREPHELRELREPILPAGLFARFEETEPLAPYFAVWSRSGSLLRRSSNAPPDVVRPPVSSFDSRIQNRTRGAFRESYQFSALGECVLVGRQIEDDLASLRGFAGWLVAAGTAVLAIGLGGVWFLATRALRPVEAIGTTARRISAGNLSERIDVAETDSELGHLASVLNSTFARLEAAFAQQRHFTADASHELRTPLAVILSETQTALARERSADEYRESVSACLEVAQQMRRLTDSLLALARLDAGEEHLELQPFDLADCARACVDLVRPLADASGLSIETDFATAPTRGDVDRIAQVLTNLLTNAIHYNRTGGRILVTTRAEGQDVFAIVADTGQGIAAEDLPRVFERFFRADKARGRASGRSGLGLAIAKAIVDAQGGRIDVASELGTGTTFTVRLPKGSALIEPSPTLDGSVGVSDRLPGPTDEPDPRSRPSATTA